MFSGRIRVFHSAIARFYAPSDLCGAGGMLQERIRSNRTWSGGPHFDTVFVVLDDSKPGMKGMLIARVLLFFSFLDPYLKEEVSCALVNWYTHVNIKPDRSTGMWVMEPEYDQSGQCTIEVIHLDTVLRGAHLLPHYGSGVLPEDFSYTDALDAFDSYYVNHYVDHHTHELLT